MAGRMARTQAAISSIGPASTSAPPTAQSMHPAAPLLSPASGGAEDVWSLAACSGEPGRLKLAPLLAGATSSGGGGGGGSGGGCTGVGGAGGAVWGSPAAAGCASIGAERKSRRRASSSRSSSQSMSSAASAPPSGGISPPSKSQGSGLKPENAAPSSSPTAAAAAEPPAAAAHCASARTAGRRPFFAGLGGREAMYARSRLCASPFFATRRDAALNRFFTSESDRLSRRPMAVQRLPSALWASTSAASSAAVKGPRIRPGARKLIQRSRIWGGVSDRIGDRIGGRIELGWDSVPGCSSARWSAAAPARRTLRPACPS